MAVANERRNSLSRGLHISGIVAEGNDSLPLSEIAHRADLSKSGAHWLLQTLVQESFVSPDGDTSRSCHRLKLLSLANSLLVRLGLDQLGCPPLEILSDTRQHIVHLAFWDTNRAVNPRKIDALTMF